ncbi:ATP-binding cassette domain-containing protein [Catenulispora subtropica]|uniref:ATP-binding cassette domain-containing protein n=1 Tax=Catenulispora subtropica TaxID=450798 RepID=UPI0031CE6B39
MSIPSDNPILLARDFGPDEVCLAVGEGEIVALSAACDEVFLRALSGADPAWPGGLWLKGEPLHTLRPAARLRFAHAQCAVAPRVGKLLPELTVAENTALPLLLTGLGRQEARRRALRWLERLDVIACADLRIADLTLAEMRRVALARALVLDPAILLAEDPTEGLNAAERFHLLRILRAACGTHGLTIVVASDDTDVVGWADRRIAVKVKGAVADAEVGAPVAEPAADPVVDPIVEPVADPIVEPVVEPVPLFGHTARGLPHRIGRHARGEHRFTPVGSGSERGR